MFKISVAQKLTELWHFEISIQNQILPAKQASMHTFDILLGYQILDHATASSRCPNLFKLIDILICTKINQLTSQYIRKCLILHILVSKNTVRNHCNSRGMVLYSDQTTFIFF